MPIIGNNPGSGTENGPFSSDTQIATKFSMYESGTINEIGVKARHENAGNTNAALYIYDSALDSGSGKYAPDNVIDHANFTLGDTSIWRSVTGLSIPIGAIDFWIKLIVADSYFADYTSGTTDQSFACWGRGGVSPWTFPDDYAEDPQAFTGSEGWDPAQFLMYIAYTPDTAPTETRFIFAPIGGSYIGAPLLEDVSGTAHELNLSDSMDIDDALTAKEFTKSLTDSIDLDESLTREVSIIRTDNVTINDDISKAIEISSADDIGLSDLISKLIQKTAADVLNLSDSITSKTFEKTENSSVSLTESIIKHVEIVNEDQIAFTDQISKEFITLIEDILTTADDVVKEIQFNLILSDSIGVSDVLTAKAFEKGIEDLISINDSISKGIVKQTDSILQLDDSIIKSLEMILPDLIQFNDQISKHSDITVADALALADSISTQLGGVYAGILKKCVDGVLVLADLPDVYNNKVVTGKRLYLCKDGILIPIKTLSN